MTLVDKIKSWFTKPKLPTPISVKHFSADPSIDALYWALYYNHQCPDCNGKDFYMGPQGGMSQNIQCANTRCASWFNVAPFEDGVWLGDPFLIQRISNS